MQVTLKGQRLFMAPFLESFLIFQLKMDVRYLWITNYLEYINLNLASIFFSYHS